MRRTAIVVACAFLVACSSASGGTSASPTTPTATATAESESRGREPTVTPTPVTPTPVAATDDERLAAALAEYDTRPAPPGTIASDVLGTQVQGDTVSLTMCTWDGLTAFDEVHTVRYNIAQDTGDTLVATLIESAPTAGDCLNTTLIDSAIAAINTHDDYWRQVLLDPATFADDPTSEVIFTEQARADLLTLTTQWDEDNVQFRGGFPGGLPDEVEAPLLSRRYVNAAGDSIFEIATCRTMSADYGLYREGALIDDFKQGSIGGPHNISAYTLIADSERPSSWRLESSKGSVWGDCQNSGDWPDAVNRWAPGSEPWTELQITR